VASATTEANTPPLTRDGATRRLPTRRNRRRYVSGEIARYLGAVSILVVGAIHAQQYYDAYFSVVPTIGTLFLLSFIGAGVVGVALLAPLRKLGRRLGDAILALAALGAIGIALGTLASLLVSEYMPLFGFMESGYRLAIVLTLVFDGLTTAFLGLFLLSIGPDLLAHRNRTEDAMGVRASSSTASAKH
jgi:hypothetical protein